MRWWTVAVVLLVLVLGDRSLHQLQAQFQDQSTDALGNDTAIDASWDFSASDLLVGLHAASEGWGNAMAQYQMNIAISVRNGVFSGLITGSQPNFASPLMQILSTPRHYLVMRMSYVGPNTAAEILVKAGPLTKAAETFTGAPETQWEGDQQPTAIHSSPAAAPTGDDQSIVYTMDQAVDGSPYTYYLSNNQSSGVEVRACARARARACACETAAPCPVQPFPTPFLPPPPNPHARSFISDGLRPARLPVDHRGACGAVGGTAVAPDGAAASLPHLRGPGPVHHRRELHVQ
jgi:hypothetical protein